MTDVQDKTHELFTRAALADVMVPRRHNPLLHWFDGVRGSTPVLVQWRAHGREREPYAVATHVGRHPLGRMRELAHAA